MSIFRLDHTFIPMCCKVQELVQICSLAGPQIDKIDRNTLTKPCQQFK